MSNLKTLGKFGYTDTGSVADSSDYTTVFLIHGFGFHGANFHKMLPFVSSSNARLVLINRRDFPGSEPYSTSEVGQLKEMLGAPSLVQFDNFMRERAKEIYEFVCAFVKQESIPVANGHRGGVVLTSWSFGAVWLMAFMSNVGSFPVEDVDLTKYMRRAILYDPPYICFGYPPPEDPYSAFSDESIEPQDRPEAFFKWVSGYYTHDFATGTLERRSPSTDVSSTVARMTPEEMQACVHADAAGAEGTDSKHFALGLATDLHSHLRRRVFFHDNGKDQQDHWDKLPIQYLWCDRSVWETPWGAGKLREELDSSEQAGKKHRDVQIVRFEGANHFPHWDEPARFLEYILREE
ncbi:hypothetical protein FZEAL_2559 [Fusarium zealandicum]|uniref:AB hydrolase-1 domain-containing protein n=1 Tax=Fusarium zealandicum TaxID=1053134 RepID=A0A8H4UQF5_9HYPO|nr:hypothetical protein FZEAL_2559 [Fusarium zealandicum]